MKKKPVELNLKKSKSNCFGATLVVDNIGGGGGVGFVCGTKCTFMVLPFPRRLQIRISERVFTLQEFGVDEQLQRQEEPHQDDAGHQHTVEAGAEQADLPQGHAATTAGLQPVGPAGGKRARSAERIHADCPPPASLCWKL